MLTPSLKIEWNSEAHPTEKRMNATAGAGTVFTNVVTQICRYFIQV